MNKSIVQAVNIPLPDGITWYVKRDDLVHPYLSGNKFRKLHFIIEEAKALGKTHLVTFGGAFSNHLVAVAAATHDLAWQCTAFVRGEELSAESNKQLQFCANMGMKFIFVDREAYRDKPTLFQKHFRDDPKALFVDEGGASINAAKGVALLVDELEEHYTHIFTACGTGATAAGLSHGIANHQLTSKVEAVAVLKNANYLSDEIKRFAPEPASIVHLHTQYHFGGYAKHTPELLSFIKSFSDNTSIPLESVYTGKLFFAIYDLIQKGYFAPNSRILAVHTGGIFSF